MLATSNSRFVKKGGKVHDAHRNTILPSATRSSYTYTYGGRMLKRSWGYAGKKKTHAEFNSSVKNASLLANV